MRKCSVRKSGTSVSKVNQNKDSDGKISQQPVKRELSIATNSLQKETKENTGVSPGGKVDAATPASSAANSTFTSPRLSLSPRMPSNSAGNPVRRSSSNKQRLGSGLLRQLDVSKSLQPESSHGAESSEPTSPSGSVASDAASIASESALLRRRGGKQLVCPPPTGS